MTKRHAPEEPSDLLPAYERAEADTRRALAGLLREAADACESDDLRRLDAVLRSFQVRDAGWRRQRAMLEQRRARRHAEKPAWRSPVAAVPALEEAPVVRASLH
jgi:hypothetical protein